MDCGHKALRTQPRIDNEQEINPKDERLLDRLADMCGVAGDFISWAAKRLNIPECELCNLRNEVLHKIKELGFMKAFSLLARSAIAQAQGDSNNIKSEMQNALNGGQNGGTSSGNAV